MQKILEPILVTIIFVGSYILNYSCFDTCLSDDVEFNYGKHKKRKIYKETHGFWRKFFFIDIRKMVSRWHYVLFIVNFVAFVLMLILVNIYVLSEENVSRWLFLICGGVYFLSSVATVYKGNIIKNLIMDCQSYTKYRPNETTGDIFVSWRRKEELPTGA